MESVLRINLLPYRDKVARRKTMLLYIWVALVIIVASYVNIFLSSYIDNKINVSNHDINTLEQEKNKLAKNNYQCHDYSANNINAVFLKANYIHAKLQKNHDVSNTLNKLANLSSESTYINKLTIKDNTLVIWVNSSSTLSVYTFTSKVKQLLPRFKLQNISFTSSKSSKKSKKKVVVKAKLEFVLDV